LNRSVDQPTEIADVSAAQDRPLNFAAEIASRYTPAKSSFPRGHVTAQNPAAGKPIDPSALVNVPRLVTAYFAGKPDPADPAQRVAFGTSGHRGSSLKNAFNENHIVATTQAICDYRRETGLTGPLFVGIDTHALAEPALASAVEVFAANGVDIMIDASGGYTPTPVISHAILSYNKGRTGGLADGVVITPSHNPPEDGGYKYNPPHGGPADTDVTGKVEKAANAFMEAGMIGVARMSYERARKAPSTHLHDYIRPYVADLGNAVDMALIKSSGVKIGIDPLGGAAVHYWQPLIEHYGINATIVNEAVDPTFRFMTADWDGKIRMDCSSPYAMASLIAMRDRFDVAFANDTDADRHGIVTRTGGLMNPNHFLAAAIAYLFEHRPQWGRDAAIGKTIVSSSIIDRVARKLNRKLVETPVGFKWFVDGLGTGAFGFAGEESAGASFLKRDGTVWTTDKDGIVMGLLAAEILGRTGRDPSQLFDGLTAELGVPFYERIDVPATPKQKNALKALGPEQLDLRQLAGEPVSAVRTRAPGNDQPFGGIKVETDGGWFAARPSGTEDVYKIYAESFRGRDHLKTIQQDAQRAIAKVL
jgi:phosphoglucomutase